MIDPVVRAAKLVNSNLAWLTYPARKLGHDERDVTSLRDHRVGLIDPALSVTHRMSVDIGNHFQFAIRTNRPDLVHRSPVKDDHAPESLGVDVVVEQELFNRAGAASFAAQQESSALANAMASLT